MTKLLCILFMIFSSAGFSQSGKFNMQLQSYLSKAEAAQIVDISLRGDIEKIKNYTLKNNGLVKWNTEKIISVRLSVEALRGLKNAEFIDYIEFSLSKGVPLNDVMLENNNVIPVHQGAGALPDGYSGEGVIMGFIDTGIELDHPDFQNEDGTTRVIALWDQTQDEILTNRIPQPYGYGQEWNAEDINAEITNHDDQANYYGHGSTVTGTAAGNGNATGNFKGVAPDADLIIVSSDFNRPNWKSSVADAVDYIFKRADELNMSAVINASLGDYLGSHDGLDAAAVFIDSLLDAKPGRFMVSAAGNSGNMGDYHLTYQVVPEDTSFTWFNYNPNSILGEGAVYFELWADTVQFKQVQYSIGADAVSPQFDFRGYVPFKTAEQNLNNLIIDTLLYNDQILGITETYVSLRGGQYHLEVKVTQPFNNQYKFRFATTGSGTFDIWSKASFGTSEILSIGLPTVAEYPEMTRYKLPDNHKTIVDSWNCSQKVISVANYTNRNQYLNYLNEITILNDTPGQISINSSRGPSRRGLQKPDISASGDITISAGRISTLNTMINTEPHKVAADGMHYVNGGTSMASPVVSGIAALYLSRCPLADYQTVKNAIVAGGTQDVFTGSVPSFRWGFGKINAFATLLSSVSPVIIQPTGTTLLCEGELLEISALNNTYSNYVWNTGEEGSNLLVDEPGEYIVSAMDENGCRQVSESLVVELLPVPEIPEVIFENDTLFSSQYSSYQWYKNGIAIPEATEFYYVPLENAVYSVAVFNDAGCSSFSEDFQVFISGLTDMGKNEFVVFPNPAKNQIIIKSNCNSCFQKLSLIDLQGKVVKEVVFSMGKTPEEIFYDLSNIAAGLYILEARGKDYNVKQKLLLTN